MNKNVTQSLAPHEVSAIFREADAAKEALMADAVNADRGRRQQPAYTGGDGEIDSAIRAAIAQI